MTGTGSIAEASRFIEIANMAGGIGLFVEANGQKAKRFCEHFGFVSLPSNKLQLFLPVATIQEALRHQ